MTYYDDPNRESRRARHRSGPVPTRNPAAAAPQPQDGFDPADHTVAEVEEYVDANPDQQAAVLDAEKAGKNRTTLVEPLEG